MVGHEKHIHFPQENLIRDRFFISLVTVRSTEFTWATILVILERQLANFYDSLVFLLKKL